MNSYDVKRLILAFALNAEMEGMKAENMQRQVLGESMAYNDSDFINISRQLEELAQKHDEEL